MLSIDLVAFIFFFQAEDGIRDHCVTGVQTCALPIYGREIAFVSSRGDHSFIAIYDFGRDSVRYLAPSADRDVSPRWSPDGKRIALMRLPGLQEKLPLIPVRVTPWSIWVADTATGNGKEIWHSGNNRMDPGGVCRADGMPRIQCDHTSDALPNHRARKRDAGAGGAACGFSFQAVGETKAGDV